MPPPLPLLEYLSDELTFFQLRPDLLYMVKPEEQKGIHCQFGMKGIIAENHYDSSRNAIVVLEGEHYILSHPNQCGNLALLPKDDDARGWWDGHQHHAAETMEHPNCGTMENNKVLSFCTAKRR
jgi:hypothetical protein